VSGDFGPTWQQGVTYVWCVILSAAPAIIAEAAKRGIGETAVEIEVELGGAVSGGGY
jgi:hypothetical protein